MELRNKKVKGRNLSELFDGLLNYKLADFLMEKANINKIYISFTDNIINYSFESEEGSLFSCAFLEFLSIKEVSTIPIPNIA